MSLRGLLRFVINSLIVLALYPPQVLGADAADNSNPGTPPALRSLLTNEGLVQLAEAGFTEDFIIDLMSLKQLRLDTSVEGLAFLARKGLSENVIRAVVRHGQPAPRQTASALAPAAPVVVLAKRGWFRQRYFLLSPGGPSPLPVAQPALIASPAPYGGGVEFVPIATHPVVAEPQAHAETQLHSPAIAPATGAPNRRPGSPALAIR
jgi:hypothetical protein